MNKRVQGNLMLLLTAMIWGMGFVAQKAGAELEPFTYNGIRMMLGGIALLPVIAWMQTAKRKREIPSLGEQKKEHSKDNDVTSLRSSIRGGICCGLLLCIASNLQQFGLYYQTDAGKAGFITSLYILFVPLLGIFLGRQIRARIWGCVALGCVGFYLLTMAGKSAGITVQTGDLFVLLCALVFAGHIMAVDYFSERCDGMVLSCVQFLTAGILSLVLMACFEHPTWEQIISLWQPLLYSGVISSGIGYTLQVLGQKHAEPTSATLIMSLESVFAVIFGVLLMGERITPVEGLGCVVIFIAVIIPQLPQKGARQIDET